MGSRALLTSWADSQTPGTLPPGDTPRDALALLKITVTGGAAPGYVEDRVCAICHKQQAESYTSVGMSRSFSRPSAEVLIEDFKNNQFFHEPSQRYYEMHWRDGKLHFLRYQLDQDGAQINLFEQKIDWIVGSGSTSRVYFYQTAAGELYQLPIAWYTQTQRWGMAPGFDVADHEGTQRRVRHECMFCHNAYPNMPQGSDVYTEPHRFPQKLPEGIGCQRCHGPGADHTRLAFEGKQAVEAIRQTIVNPARLAPQLRNDVCFQCHLQSSVVLHGVRRFGRSYYSFQPGQSLADYLVMLDIEDANMPRDERFEINHHAYRLLQSRCYTESQAALSCLSCHDPHRKVPSGERAAHYRTVCLGCHKQDQLHRNVEAKGETQGDDCVSCHMPRRRPQDVVQVVMTDHRIQRGTGGRELRAPLAETTPVVTGISLRAPQRAPIDPLGQLYRVFAAAQIGSGGEALSRLDRLLQRYPQSELDPYFALIKGQVQHRQFAAAERALHSILKKYPTHPQFLEWLGLAQFLQKQPQAAITRLRQALRQAPDSPEAHFNLGLILGNQGVFEEAAQHLERALALRPNLAAAEFFLGKVLEELGFPSKAVEHYRRALAITPTHARAYEGIGRLLLQAGQRSEALRYWRHGARIADKPQMIQDRLSEIQGEPTEEQDIQKSPNQ